MNEVNILNIGGIDYNIDDQLARDVIAHSENGLDPQSNLPISSRHYDEGDYLIGQDRLYYEVTSDIEIGDVIAEGVNVRATIVSDELVRLKNQSSIAVIQSIAKVESEALSSRNYTVGQYFYWDFGLTAGLYETIATITSGDAFSVGVNIKLANKIIDMVDGLQDAYNITGAKNLCTSLTADIVNHGITYDVLSDGSVNVTGTSDSGGSSGSGIWLDQNGIVLPAGTYKLTTGQSDEANAGVVLKVVLKSNTGTTLGISNANDGIFTLSSPTEVVFGLNTVPPTVSINVRIFPMCRVASITDESYAPYAMTNRQLTNIFSDINTKVNANTWIQFGSEWSFTPSSAGQHYIAHSFGRIPSNARRIAISQCQDGDIETFVELFKGHATCVTEFSRSYTLCSWDGADNINASYVYSQGTNRIAYKVFYML